MKKTIKFALLACLILLACTFMFSACKCKHLTSVGVLEVAPTCTEAGLTKGRHCLDCGEVFVPQMEIDALGHTVVVHEAVAPTCTSSGLTEGKHCSVCDEVLVAQTKIDAFGHTVVVDEAITPTCTEAGLTEGKHCSVCDEVLVAQKIVNALAHNFVDDYCTVCEKKDPGYTRDGDYIYFGEYPQTVKAMNVTITDIVDERGYYLGSDGCYYAKVTATHISTDYFIDFIGKDFYFKVEPIRWRILSTKLSTDKEIVLILCDSIIEYMPYDVGQYSYYPGSDIRAWLNATFYETAFSQLQQEIILTTTVFNGVAGDTEDKIFLPSCSEVTNSDYGFSTNEYENDTARQMKSSKYSSIKGAGGDWWLRWAPFSGGTYERNVSSSGSVREEHYVFYNLGVVPAMWIDLNP